MSKIIHLPLNQGQTPKQIEPTKNTKKIIADFNKATNGWFKESDIKFGNDRKEYISLLDDLTVNNFSVFNSENIAGVNKYGMSGKFVENLTTQWQLYFTLILNTEKTLYNEQQKTMKGTNTMSNESIIKLIEKLDAVSYLYQKQIELLLTVKDSAAPKQNVKQFRQMKNTLGLLLPAVKDYSWLVALLFDPVKLQEINHYLSMSQAQEAVMTGIPDKWIAEHFKLSLNQLHNKVFIR